MIRRRRGHAANAAAARRLNWPVAAPAALAASAPLPESAAVESNHTVAAYKTAAVTRRLTHSGAYEYNTTRYTDAELPAVIRAALSVGVVVTAHVARKAQTRGVDLAAALERIRNGDFEVKESYPEDTRGHSALIHTGGVALVVGPKPAAEGLVVVTAWNIAPERVAVMRTAAIKSFVYTEDDLDYQYALTETAAEYAGRWLTRDSIPAGREGLMLSHLFEAAEQQFPQDHIDRIQLALNAAPRIVVRVETTPRRQGVYDFPGWLKRPPWQDITSTGDTAGSAWARASGRSDAALVWVAETDPRDREKSSWSRFRVVRLEAAAGREVEPDAEVEEFYEGDDAAAARQAAVSALQAAQENAQRRPANIVPLRRGAAGQSVTLYHGSDAPDIQEFEASAAGRHGYFGAGLYTTPNFEEAAFYGRYVYEGLFDGRIFDGIHVASDEDSPEAVGDLGDVLPSVFWLGGAVYTTSPSPNIMGMTERIAGASWNAYLRVLAAAGVPKPLIDALISREQLTRDSVPDEYDVEEALAATDDPTPADDYARRIEQTFAAQPKEATYFIESDEIGQEVEAAGYDAVEIPGLERNEGHTEVVIFDPTRFRVVRVHDTQAATPREAAARVRVTAVSVVASTTPIEEGYVSFDGTDRKYPYTDTTTSPLGGQTQEGPGARDFDTPDTLTVDLHGRTFEHEGAFRHSNRVPRTVAVAPRRAAQIPDVPPALWAAAKDALARYKYMLEVSDERAALLKSVKEQERAGEIDRQDAERLRELEQAAYVLQLTLYPPPSVWRAEPTSAPEALLPEGAIA